MSETNDVNAVVMLSGTRVKVLGRALLLDDIKRPVDITIKLATSTRRIGRRDGVMCYAMDCRR